MRPIEIQIPLLLALHLLWTLSQHRPRAAAWLPFIVLMLIPLHILTEGMRWQMYPVYALSVVIFLAGLPEMLQYGGQNKLSLPRAWHSAAVILGLVLLFIAGLIPVLLPVPSMPAPTGPYTVGTRTLVLTDQQRKEVYSGKDEARTFMLQIWYPGVPPDADLLPSAWMPEASIVAPAIAEYIELPAFFLNHLSLARSNSFTNIPPNRNNGPYPLLIFSHGWNGFRQQSTFLMQELASYGYIVVALEHTYGARLTVFPDGSLAPNNPNALPAGLPRDEYEAAAQKLVNQWAEDISYTLDVLNEINQGMPLAPMTSMISLEKTGVFGHSTGGGAAIQFCGTDSRCRAGLTLDAFVRPLSPQVLEAGTQQPFLHIFSELWPFERNTELFEQYYNNADSGSSRVITILGADHYDFSDLPALSPLSSYLGLKGPISATRVQKIINAYVLAFFDWQLKGRSSPLLDGPQPRYPEVRYDR